MAIYDLWGTTGAISAAVELFVPIYTYRAGQKSRPKPLLIYQYVTSYVRKALLFCMYANSGMTASYIKLIALFVVLNILWFSVADTRMRRSYSSIRAINMHTVIDVTLYVIHRIFNR